MAKSRFQEFISNKALMLDIAMTQERLKRAGVTISKDLYDEGFVPYEQRKFPKWVKEFVACQMKRMDKAEEYERSRKAQ